MTQVPYPWGTCDHSTCATIGVRCVQNLCPKHCAALHKDSSGAWIHVLRTTEEELQAKPYYNPKPPRLVATHKFLEETA